MVTFLDNFLLGIALTLPLGPVTLEILRRGLKLGFLQAAITAIGAFSAELTYFTIVYLGLSKLSTNNFIRIGLGILGVGFLLYIGYQNLRDFYKNTDASDKNVIYKNPFVCGYVITFFNPLNFFMWAGIIGGFFAQNTSLFVSSGVLLGIFLSLLLVAIISKIGQKFIKNKHMRYVALIAGLFLIFYGLRLLYNLITG